MSAFTLQGSLTLWRQRVNTRRRLLAHALKMVAKRKRQIAAAAAAQRPTIMFDSVTVGNMPASAPAVAGYTSGLFPTWPHLAALFPHARRLSIAVSSAHDAECLDVEPGDATPAVAAGWVKRQQARGIKRPVIYASRDNMPAVLAALQAAGIPRSAVRLWSAHYTFHEHICSPACGARFTADATQWTDKAIGRSLDQSKVDPSFWA
jgi:hypothetical protein